MTITSGNKNTEIEIITGIEGGKYIEVLSGLNEGSEVLTEY